MPATDVEALRSELRRIGSRRARLNREAHDLARDTAAAIQNARGKLSMTEAAKLIGLDRGAVYRTYGGQPTPRL